MKNVDQVYWNRSKFQRIFQHLGRFSLIIVGMTLPSASIIIFLLTGALSLPSSHEEGLLDSNASQPLPTPLPQRDSGAQPRNYVAYIPVPISDEDEEDEYYDEEEYDDEYYDEDDEYYEDEEDEDVKRPPKRRPNRNRKRPNRRKYRPSNEEQEGGERVPFLVPLMMVPESEIGIDKPFSFSGKDPNVSNKYH